MKKNYSEILKNFKNETRNTLLLCMVVAGGLSNAQTYSFTPAGSTGVAGPSQGQLNTAYAATNLNGLVTSLSGKQSFTITSSGAYQIQAYGAKGGNSGSNTYTGGNGSYISAEFNLAPGDVIEMIVGQLGGNGNSNGSTWTGGGGGGGSFVRINGVLALAAGGGGGAGTGEQGANGYNGNPATITTSGASANGSNANINGTAGTGGNGGTGGSWYSGAGGGGYLSNGTNPGTGQTGSPGLSYGNGGNGGAGTSYQSVNCGNGGFGGGSGASLAGAGGGGYSGGAGGTHGASYNATAGGGGGSYVTGSNTLATAGTNSNDGMVVLTKLCNVQINGSTNICAGGSTTLTSTAVSNISWSTGSTAQSVVFNPQVTTQYTVSGNGSQNNCTSVIVFSIVVYPLPAITPFVSPALLCVGSEATVTATGANTYTWSSGPTSSITTLGPVITTTYSVAGTSTAGCINTTIFSVNVNTLQLTITGNTAICMGKSTSLTGSGGTNLGWSGFGPFPTINPSPTVATVYTLTGIDANNCLLQQPVTVIVNPNPVVTISASKTLTCKGLPVTLTAGGADTYSWSATAGSVTNPVATVIPAINTTYNYSVTGTDVNGCTGTANVSVRAELCTGIHESILHADVINVYPNPNNGHFTISANTGVVLNIVNQLGQNVKTLVIPDSGEVFISDLSKGIYFVIADSNGTKLNKKIIIN